MQALADRIDRLNASVGRAAAWLSLLMVIVTAVVVVLRYWFDAGWIWMQESVTWMHAALFMLAAAWTLGVDDHVRVDIFYRRMPPRGQAMVNLAGTVLFLLPVAGFLIWTSWDYVAVSWQTQEDSAEAGGLVFPFPSLMKTLIPITAALLALQGLAILLKAILALRTTRP